MSAGSLAQRHIAVYGLGEAGSEIAADLARLGADVRGFDPATVATPPGVQRVDEPTAAVDGAELVLAVTAAADAPGALEQGLDAVPRGAVYADLAAASPGLEARLARTAAAAGLRFADVALMATVPGTGLFTPQLASGQGAAEYVAMLGGAGVPVEVVEGEAGAASTRKLLRSVAVKGVAAALIESMRAAETAGLGSDTWGNLVQQFGSMDEAFLRRLIAGTSRHAERRRHEMEAAVELLGDLGVDSVLTAAVVESLDRIRTNGVPEIPGDDPPEYQAP